MCPSVGLGVEVAEEPEHGDIVEEEDEEVVSGEATPDEQTQDAMCQNQSELGLKYKQNNLQ